MMTKRTTMKIINYVFLFLVGIVLIYPLVWLFFASFKSNTEIFGTTQLLPQAYSFDAFRRGWEGSGQYTYGVFLANTFKLVIPTVLFTAISSVLVAYGFSRFHFPYKKALMGLLIATLMLPNSIIIIPRYMLFRDLHWLDSYLPFVGPALFACYPFFTYLMIQFFRGLPRELDESAKIDGCNSFSTLYKILLPLCKPAIFSVCLLQFIWTWNDFFNPFIFINSVSKYPVSLGLRMSLDSQMTTNWDQIMAMAIVTILPCILLFFFAQRYFIEGIATTGLKG